MTDAAAPTVLVVDKSRDVRDLMYDVFQPAGYRCLLAGDGLEAMDIVRRERPALVLTSLSVPIVNGIELLRYARGKDPDVAVIVMIGDWRETSPIRDCYKLGAFKVVTKPLQVDEVLIYAERALEWRQLHIERRSGWVQAPLKASGGPGDTAASAS
jgi:two-component system nitrogen regulation response regulator NtrX